MLILIWVWRGVSPKYSIIIIIIMAIVIIIILMEILIQVAVSGWSIEYIRMNIKLSDSWEKELCNYKYKYVIKIKLYTAWVKY